MRSNEGMFSALLVVALLSMLLAIACFVVAGFQVPQLLVR